jgi:hypothetical protein
MLHQGTARDDTATDRWPHTSAFFGIKNYSQKKIAQNKIPRKFVGIGNQIWNTFRN